MNASPAPPPPQIKLSRGQWQRLIVVGFFVVIALARVVPDGVRIVFPLGLFGYATDGDGVVVAAPKPTPVPRPTAHPRATHAPVVAKHGKHRAAPRPSPAPVFDQIRIGDRVRVDRITPFDRKPGIAGSGYTRDNPDRHLPVDRGGRPRVLLLRAHDESVTSRVLVVVRIVVFAVTVGLGAILFLVKPSLATFGFFIFCLGGEYPTTYADVAFDNPWRQAPIWLGNTLRGASVAGLLVFAFSLITTAAQRQRLFAYAAGALALVAGTAHAYAPWRRDFGGLPANGWHLFDADLATAINVLAGALLVVASVRARGGYRARNGWILASFGIALGARFVSDQFYPGHIPTWVNGLLVCAAVVPAVAVWVAVWRDRFFDVDFVVSRAIVYVAIAGAAAGIFTVTEESLTYLIVNNTDIAYGIFFAISTVIGMTFGRTVRFIHQIVDRFIFRGRGQQRVALQLIAGYILDAENEEDVVRALLEDATHALGLAFAGILERLPDGDYELVHRFAWPDTVAVRLGAQDDLTMAIARSRGSLSFTGSESKLIQRAFPTEPLTFAAPIFIGRAMAAIVVYGHNVSGLELDPEERELLVRVISHASIALSAIELSRYKALAAERGMTSIAP